MGRKTNAEFFQEIRDIVAPEVNPEPQDDRRFKVYQRAIEQMTKEQSYLFPAAMSPWQFRSDVIYMGHDSWGTKLTGTTLAKLVEVVGRAIVDVAEEEQRG
jgi:hypothetical protein